MQVIELLKKLLSSWVIAALIYGPYLNGCRERSPLTSSPDSFGSGSEHPGKFVYGKKNLEKIVTDLESNLKRWLECVNWDQPNTECDPTTFNQKDDVEFMRHYINQLFLAKALLEDENTPPNIRAGGNLDEVNADIEAALKQFGPVIKAFEQEYLTSHFGENPFRNQSEGLLQDNEDFENHLASLSSKERGEELELHLLLLTKMDPTFLSLDPQSSDASDFVPRFVSKFFSREIIQCVVYELDSSYDKGAADDLCAGIQASNINQYADLLHDIFQLAAVQKMVELGRQEGKDFGEEADQLKKMILGGSNLGGPKITRELLTKVLGVIPRTFEDFVPMLVDDIPSTAAELPEFLKSFKESKVGEATIKRLRTTLSRSFSIPETQVRTGASSGVNVLEVTDRTFRNLAALLGVAMITLSSMKDASHEAKLGIAMGTFVTFSRTHDVVDLFKFIGNREVIKKFVGDISMGANKVSSSVANNKVSRAIGSLFKGLTVYGFNRLTSSLSNITIDTLNTLGTKLSSSLMKIKGLMPTLAGGSQILGGLAGVIGGIMFSIGASKAENKKSFAIQTSLAVIEFAGAGLAFALVAFKIPGANLVLAIAAVVALILSLVNSLVNKDPRQTLLESDVHPHKSYWGDYSTSYWKISSDRTYCVAQQAGNIYLHVNRSCANSAKLYYEARTAMWHEKTSGKCLAAGSLNERAPVRLGACDEDSPNQKWYNQYNEKGAIITLIGGEGDALGLSIFDSRMVLSNEPLSVVTKRYPRAFSQYGINQDISFLSFSNVFGNRDGGDTYSTKNQITKSNKITHFGIWSGDRIDGFQYSYTGGEKVKIGGKSGDLELDLNIEAHQYLKDIQVCLCSKAEQKRKRVCAMEITVAHRKSAEAKKHVVNEPGGECHQINAPVGSEIIGFRGNAGDELDSFGAIFRSLP